MTCDRCKDVHNAQLCGFTVKSCECSCHYNYTSATTTTIPFNYTGTIQ
mgnify:CR=1 FL=1